MFERSKELTGQRFGKLVALHREGKQGKHVMWRFQCDCGNFTVARGANVEQKTNPIRSCGCGRASMAPEYRAWRFMIRRCCVPHAHNYKNYGGRGVKVCEAWKTDFEAFLREIGPRPSPDFSIDRIRNEGDYEPGNVQWSTRATQQNNTRRNIRSGERFASLVAIELTDPQGSHARWIVKCDCGKTAKVRADNLKSSKQRSCGCLRKREGGE
jgi:hypothetical protein